MQISFTSKLPGMLLKIVQKLNLSPNIAHQKGKVGVVNFQAGRVEQEFICMLQNVLDVKSFKSWEQKDLVRMPSYKLVVLGEGGVGKSGKT